MAQMRYERPLHHEWHLEKEVNWLQTSTAYRHCENVVRTRARNFAYGIRLLPPPKRRARRAGDGVAQLTETRDELAPLGARAAEPDAPVLVALADAARRFPVPLEAFGELID